MVEVFKTNVTKKRQAQLLQRQLSLKMPDCQINFDLTDDDRILRIKSLGKDIDAGSVIDILNQYQFHCSVLPE